MNSEKVLERLTLKFLGVFSDTDLKRMKKKLKESRKAVNNGRKREFYLSEYIPQQYLVTFIEIQNDYFKEKFKKERIISSEFLLNESEALKYAFYTEEYEENALKQAEEEVNLMTCPEGENESKFRRKQLKNILKRIIPEQTIEQVKEWADQAYPSITDELWEVEVEEALVSLA